ncbi:MAG: hypothetical protein ACRD8O_10135, partial [Bryobacteraceae bacterium]
MAQEPAAAASQSASAQAPAPEYQGPAILSRGGGPGFGLPLARIKLRPFLSLMGSYDRGITPIIITPNGQLLNEHSFGGSVGFGLSSYLPGRK